MVKLWNKIVKLWKNGKIVEHLWILKLIVQ
jgi:hypothetical protein